MEKMSETLQQRIEETRGEILALEARQKALTAEKTALLASSTIDTKALAKLEQEESRIPSTLDSLQTRCTLLGAQIEQAEKDEAVTRIAEIELELAQILPTLKAQHEAWLEGVKKLAQLLEHNGKEQARVKVLREEGAYLVEAFNAPWPHGGSVPSPSRADLGKIEEQFRRKVWNIVGGSPWQEKTAALRKQKNAVAVAEAEEQRQRSHSRMVTRRPAPFTLGKSA